MSPRLFAALLVLSCAITLPVHAFRVFENFEGYAPGSLATVSAGAWQVNPAGHVPQVVAAPDSGGNYAAVGLATGGGPFPSIFRTLPSEQAIPQTGLSTFFFRVRPQGARIDASVGLAEQVSSPPAFDNFRVQIAFLNAAVAGSTHFRVAVRSGGSTFEVLASAPKGAWYAFWVVVDRDRNLYDVWYSPDGGHPVLLANDYSFRSAPSGAFGTVLVVANGQNSDTHALHLDHMHTRPGRRDLSHPDIPAILPAPLRVATFNAQSGTGPSLATFRDNYLNGDHLVCLQEVVPGNWNAIQAEFPRHPHRLLTVKRSTAPFTFKTEAVALLSTLPILESDAAIMQIDPQADRWERWAQYVKLDLGEGRVARVFHFHNTYNFNENNFEWEKSGLVAFRDWILAKTGAATLAAVPDLVVLGDLNLTSSADVLAILPMPLVHANGRDYILSTLGVRARTTLWTNGVISDHNGLASSLDPLVAHDTYAKWAHTAFTLAELSAGLGDAEADPDDDGRNNFAAYAFNLHPWRSTPPPPVVRVEEQAFHFRRGAGRGDIRFELLGSTTLDAWSPLAIAEAGGAMTATGDLPVIDSPATSDGTRTTTLAPDFAELRSFYRLNATAVP